MEIILSYDNLNLLIFFVGGVILLHLLTIRSSKKRTIKFGNFEILERIAGKKLLSPNIIPLILRILALIIIVLAASNVIIRYEEKISNTNFVLAMDTSSSMLTSDYKPNRLEAAKESALGIIDKLPPTTKIGIVSFAGKAYTRLDLTDNKEKIKEAIQLLDLDTPAGTAIGDALILSSTLLINSNETGKKNKVIVLITDGINNAGVGINESLEFVKSNQIRVFPIGIGSRENLTNETIQLPENLTNATISRFPNLNEESLKLIANETNGTYYTVTNESSFKSIFEKVILKGKTIELNLTYFLLILAGLILLLEWSLGATKYKTLP